MIGRALPTAPGQKVDFNALKAPSNYVPGLGRGATGFTTRSGAEQRSAAPPLHAAPLPCGVQTTAARGLHSFAASRSCIQARCTHA
jgi:hypothetical protein